MNRPDYSIVVPVKDEADCLSELIDRLTSTLEQLDGAAEVLFVDDGSRDDSYQLLVEAHRRDPRFKVLQLSRNFGHQVALTAGLDHANGLAVIAMDADLQDPPEVILAMAAKWREGYEIVHAVRTERKGERGSKRVSAALYYRLLRHLTDVDIRANVGDFRLVDRRALEAFRSMRESNRYVRGLFAWIGYRQTEIPYVRAPRHAGDTKYSLGRMLKLAFDGVIGFSTVPLRIALRIGFVLSILSLLGAGVAIVLKLSGTLTVPGWASLIVAIGFLGGIQLSTLGIMGEYLARIQDEVRGRPLYFVRGSHGILPESEPAGSELDRDAVRGVVRSADQADVYRAEVRTK